MKCYDKKLTKKLVENTKPQDAQCNKRKTNNTFDT